jgi:hypothetical protein
LIISFLSLRSETAIACVALPLPTVLDAYEEADVVIIARMISIEKTKEPDPVHFDVRSATMVIQKIFKGNVKLQDRISFAQGNGIDCLWMFDEKMIGQEYLLYLNIPEQRSDLWYLGQGRSGELGATANDLRYLNNVEKVRGQTRVSGTLEDDFPVAGRKVRIIGRSKSFQTTIDENGVYEIYGLPPGNYLIAPELPYGWIIDQEGFPTVSEKPSHSNTQKAFTLKPKRHAVIDFAFKIDNVVEGNVVDEKGRPLAQASIVLKPENDVDNEASKFLDKKGHFRFESVQAGSYELIVHEPITQPLTRVGYYDPQKDRLLKSVPISIKHGQSMRGIKIIVPAARTATP